MVLSAKQRWQCGTWTVLGLAASVFRESLAWLWPVVIIAGVLIQLIGTRPRQKNFLLHCPLAQPSQVVTRIPCLTVQPQGHLLLGVSAHQWAEKGGSEGERQE